jgi:MoxR-like ATPase
VSHLLREQDEHVEPRRSVVLIDEIDKAPRDFPNDLLNEVEGTYFRIPELGNVTVTARPELRPVLVLTSNSEKNLAEAFLRRCIFYHLPFPDENRLVEIVQSRLGEAIAGRGPLLTDALAIFHRLRTPIAALSKKPSTAELLAWLRVLTARPGNSGLRAHGEAMIEPALCCLVKTVEDRPKAHEILREWLQSTSQ